MTASLGHKTGLDVWGGLEGGDEYLSFGLLILSQHE